MLIDILLIILFLYILKFIFLKPDVQYGKQSDILYSQLYVNQPLVYTLPVIDTRIYAKNDIVNNIQTDTSNSGISYKNVNLGDVCNISSDCPDGLVCSSIDNMNFTCNRRIPSMECTGITCDTNSRVGLGESCGGDSVNVSSNICVQDSGLQCVSSSYVSTSSGLCSIIK
jgi:hypothetical protein